VNIQVKNIYPSTDMNSLPTSSFTCCHLCTSFYW